MQYRWTGWKPLHRASNVTKTKGRSLGQVPEVMLTDVVRGTVFEPTEAERVSFGDLMEPVGAFIATGEPQDEHEHEHEPASAE